MYSCVCVCVYVCVAVVKDLRQMSNKWNGFVSYVELQVFPKEKAGGFFVYVKQIYIGTAVEKDLFYSLIHVFSRTQHSRFSLNFVRFAS